MQTANKIKVYIVDDHEMFREGVKMLLSNSSQFEVIGEAANGKECIKKLPANTDVILMDILMPVMDGIETTQQLIASNPSLKIIALSMFGEQEYYYKMIHSGVKGFVLKEAGSRELEEAIKEVFEGRNFFSQELLRNIIVNLTEKKNDQHESDFTIREIEILQHICSGYSNKEIAEKLNISVRTIENHKSNLLQKTGTKNTVSLIIYAIKNEIVKI
ncbi:MAG: response regulator transcription factor [Marinilabiliaceae bacterium]|nr:response regulator transcription factor [Marinilabiliaceae bacterium]